MDNIMSYNNYVSKANTGKYFMDGFFNAKSFEAGFIYLTKSFKIDLSTFSDEDIKEYYTKWNVWNRHRKIKEILE